MREYFYMYKTVCQFIPYSETKPTVGVQESYDDLGTNCLILPAVNYCSDFLLFVYACSASGVTDIDYLSVMLEYNWHNFSCKEAKQLIQSAIALLFRAILTKCLRQERFNMESQIQSADNVISFSQIKRFEELNTDTEV